MATLQHCLLLLLAIAMATKGSPVPQKTEEENYEYEDGEEERGTEESAVLLAPKFITEAESVLVNQGDTIRLPCLVDRFEGLVMLWKKNGDIITVASQIIDKRVKLEENKNGNYLVINQAGPEDKGSYTCQISAWMPTYPTHTVNIRTPPVVSVSPESGVLVVTAGNTAQMDCRVESGSPAPSLQWVREGHEGLLDSQGGRLVMEEVTRHQGGVYSCQADNGFGPQPVTKVVKLEIHYPPHLSVEHPSVETGPGETKHLLCIVHASPKAKVTWMRNGELVDTSSPQFEVNSDRHRHSLTVLSISSDKLGSYQCVAENTLGKEEKTIHLKGHASPAVMLSPANSELTQQHTLKWRAASISPIEMFRVEVQKEGQEKVDSAWVVNEVEIEEKENEQGGGHPTSYQGTLLLRDLLPNTRYKARISSRNAFGFNMPEEDFIFATKGAGPVQQPSVLASSSSCLQSLPLLLLAVVTTIRNI